MPLTLDKFKETYSDLIEKKVITFDQLGNIHYIILDRFVGGDFVCDKNELNKARNHVIKMGYTKRIIGLGYYGREIN